MKSIVRVFVVALVVSVLGAAAFGQGVVWQTKIVANGHEMTTHTCYLPKKLKTTNEGGDDFSIIRLDQEKIYNINGADKTYSVMTFAELEQMGKQMNARMDELQKQMKDMPEEQRKMMEKMMGSSMPGAKKDPKIEVIKTGEKKTINGFACSHYKVTQDGKEAISLWVTPDVKAYAAMKQDMAEQSKRMAALTPGGLKGLTEAMLKVDGFPIETEMGTLMKSTVLKIEAKSVSASEFEVPAGYKLVKNKMQEEEK
jgi:GLPGLI family protein